MAALLAVAGRRDRGWRRTINRILQSLVGWPAGLLLGLTVLALAGVACDDTDLNQLGAPGAHTVTYTLDLTEGSITVASSEGATQISEAPLVLGSPTHTDFTMIFHNLTEMERSVTLYADEARTLEMASTPVIPPGQESRIVIHFHDEQKTYFADSLAPDTLSGTIEVHAE